MTWRAYPNIADKKILEDFRRNLKDTFFRDLTDVTVIPSEISEMVKLYYRMNLYQKLGKVVSVLSSTDRQIDATTMKDIRTFVTEFEKTYNRAAREWGRDLRSCPNIKTLAEHYCTKRYVIWSTIDKLIEGSSKITATGMQPNGNDRREVTLAEVTKSQKLDDCCKQMENLQLTVRYNRVKVENDIDIKYNMTIGDYKLDTDNTIGAGTFGAVYLGVCSKTSEIIAAKEVSLKGVLQDCLAERRKILEDEIKALKLGKGHPNIVKYFATVRQGKSTWIMMEYCRMGDLQEYLKKVKNFLPNDLLLIYVTNAGEALNFLHQRSPPIVHRDIKLTNFLLQLEDHPVLKLCDFGLVKLLPESTDLRTFYMNTAGGTPAYMAPEFFTQDYVNYDKSVDVFSLGLVFQVLINYDGNDDYLQPSSVEMRNDNMFLPFGQEVALARKRGGKLPSLFPRHEGANDLRFQLKRLTERMVGPTRKERITSQQVRDRLQELKQLDTGAVNIRTVLIRGLPASVTDVEITLQMGN